MYCKFYPEVVDARSKPQGSVAPRESRLESPGTSRRGGARLLSRIADALAHEDRGLVSLDKVRRLAAKDVITVVLGDEALLILRVCSLSTCDFALRGGQRIHPGTSILARFDTRCERERSLDAQPA